jgi:hypothetical protein
MFSGLTHGTEIDQIIHLQGPSGTPSHHSCLVPASNKVEFSQFTPPTSRQTLQTQMPRELFVRSGFHFFSNLLPLIPTVIDMNGNNWNCIYSSEMVAHVQHVYNHGHEIASHTWSHPNVSKLTNAEIDVEIMRLDQAFIKILGVKPNIFRYVLFY